MHYFSFIAARLAPARKRRVLPFPEPAHPWASAEVFEASIDPFAAPWWVLAAWRKRQYPDGKVPTLHGEPSTAALAHLEHGGAVEPPEEELQAFEASLYAAVDMMLGRLSIAEIEAQVMERLGLQPAELMPLVRTALETSRYADQRHVKAFLERRAIALSEAAMAEGNLREAREATKLLAQLHGLTTPANQILILNQEREREIQAAFEVDVKPLDRPRVHLPAIAAPAAPAVEEKKAS